jgi:hypothetical protein
MQELGPFRVNSDGTTLTLNKDAWNVGKHALQLMIVDGKISY